MDVGLGVKVDNIVNNLMIVMGYQATYWLYIVEHENFLYPSYSNQRPTTKILSSCFLLGLQTTMIDYAREGPPQNRSSGSSSSSSASLTAASAFSFLLLGTQMYLILPCCLSKSSSSEACSMRSRFTTSLPVVDVC